MNKAMAVRILFSTLFILVLGCTLVSEGRAEVYLTPEQAIDLAFPDADEVQRQSLSLNAELRARIQERSRNRVAFSKMDVYIGMSQGKPVGYAMIHHVKGKARPITFMTVIGPDGKVRQVEILAYRESHGGEIRYPSFLKQFIGKNISDPIRNKMDIRNISGATISCRAVADGVRTIVSLWESVYAVRKDADRIDEESYDE